VGSGCQFQRFEVTVAEALTAEKLRRPRKASAKIMIIGIYLQAYSLKTPGGYLAVADIA
jgi:hypothetical protein